MKAAFGQCPFSLQWPTLKALRQGASSYFSNRTALPKLVGDANQVAAIVLSFNHVQNVDRIAAALQRENGIGEVIIAEDGSSDGSKDAWRRALGPSDQIIHTNNLHEIRAYNNAARAVKRSGVLCFLQDDDIPNSHGWAHELLELIDAFRHERLAVLSGLAAEMCQIEIGEQQVEHPATMKNFKRTNKIPYVFRGRIPFMFVTEAWLSPMCVRTDVWRELGGYDESLTLPGEPGIGLDIHFSLRAGVSGYTIGVHGAPFARGIGGHGSVSDAVKTAKRLQNRQRISLRIRQVAGCRWPPAMLRHVKNLNMRYLSVRTSGSRLLDDIDAKCKTFRKPCVFKGDVSEGQQVFSAANPNARKFHVSSVE